MQIENLTKQTSVLTTQFANVGIFFLNEKEVILIDTGHIHEALDLCQYFQSNNLTVVGIINTHGHIDHVGANFKLQEIYHCQIAMPYVDHIFCEDISRYYMSFSTSVVGGLSVYGHGTFNIDHLIGENETSFEFCGIRFECIGLKGHTFNQKGIVTPDGVCFVGDSLIHMNVLEKVKFPVVTNIEWHFETLNLLKRLDYHTYVLGHGPVIATLGQTIESNVKYFHQKIEEVALLIQKVSQFDEIMYELNKVYNIRKNIFKYFVAERTIRAILSYLEQEERIQIKIEQGVMVYKPL
ncbi:MBL fold metallo-hydrolase [Fusibacter ferrireducens]|uniref:MBL fold metallo-hydrolase n=1 Tax=Fusibacter ferrireducens TaxID=2785058 RepID=A0ABR9ZZL3_9FIRM|nr:MBL fold metallo-hydrolase [Fusibacter ferrireducens]MBF4695890.1 MBL fold metallo-hydrolase [Fusibacter ferrireducens]